MFRFLLNLLFPAPPRVAELESMDAAAFRAAVASCEWKPHEWLLPLFPYENQLVKTAVWEIKYRGNIALARLAGTLIADELAEWLAELYETENFREPLLIPIPLARGRRAERGFNQCELLASAVRSAIPDMIKVETSALVKVKETESQTKSKNRAERIKNLRGCFAVRSTEKIKNRNIVLLDDVTTTGATLSEARAALLLGGARKVIAITFAH